MISSRAFDWAPIRLVVFDVDGTLYRQLPLRLRMAVALITHGLCSGSFRDLSVIRRYRELRERIGDQELENFEERLVADVAEQLELAPEQVREIVSEWIDKRPLPALLRARYAGVEKLFQSLRLTGRKIGVLSDYLANAKLAALGLEADYVVSACDVGVLKPHSRGLEHVISLAGERPDTTLLIGDRADRDGEAARRAGVQCLLRTTRPSKDHHCFATYNDPLFRSLHEYGSVSPCGPLHPLS